MSVEYLTYEEYKALAVGNPVSEGAFAALYPRAKAKVDYYTFGRLKSYETIPQEVKLLLCDIISVVDRQNSQSFEGLTSYSNGIESFGFSVGAESYARQLETNIYLKVKEYLSGYPDLICRLASHVHC